MYRSARFCIQENSSVIKGTSREIVFGSLFAIVLYFLSLFLWSLIIQLILCSIFGFLESRVYGCGPVILWTVLAAIPATYGLLLLIFNIYPISVARTVTIVFIIGSVFWTLGIILMGFWFVGLILAIIYVWLIWVPTLIVATYWLYSRQP